MHDIANTSSSLDETLPAFSANSNSTSPVLGHAANSTRSGMDGSPRRRSKRAVSDEVEADDNAVGMPKTEQEASAADPITDGFISMFFGGDKCKMTFYKCIAKVAKGSAHYMNEPNGLYRYA